ncbi:hypothetical protein FA95DRAFT_1505855, partial [Auriscalpium vulgare]
MVDIHPKIEKLLDDGSNWPSYKDIVLNAFMKRKLMRHIRGTAKKPKNIMLHKDGSYYEANTPEMGAKPLADDVAEKRLEEVEEYKSKEASIREIVYNSVSPGVLALIRKADSAADMWKTLEEDQEVKGVDVPRELTRRMRSLRCDEGADPTPVITKMTVALAITLDTSPAPTHTAAAAQPFYGIIMDSGASIHICPDRSKYVNFRAISDLPITAAYGQQFNAVGTGKVRL